MHNMKYIEKVILDKAVKICEKETIWIAHWKLLTASFYSVYFNDVYNFNRLKKQRWLNITSQQEHFGSTYRRTFPISTCL